ncbi:DENN domain-containing protein, partial [Schistosoma japonicum]
WLIYINRRGHQTGVTLVLSSNQQICFPEGGTTFLLQGYVQQEQHQHINVCSYVNYMLSDKDSYPNENQPTFLNRFEAVNSWMKLQRMVAWLMLYKHSLMNKLTNRQHLTVAESRSAELNIIRLAQKECFNDVFKLLNHVLVLGKLVRAKRWNFSLISSAEIINKYILFICLTYTRRPSFVNIFVHFWTKIPIKYFAMGYISRVNCLLNVRLRKVNVVYNSELSLPVFKNLMKSFTSISTNNNKREIDLMSFMYIYCRNLSVLEKSWKEKPRTELVRKCWSATYALSGGNSALWSHLVLYAKRVDLMKQINKDVTVNDDCELLNLESSPPTSSSSCGSSPLISDPRSRANLDLGNSRNLPDVHTLSPDFKQNLSRTDTMHLDYSSLKRVRKFPNDTVHMPKSNQPSKTILSYRSGRFPWHDLSDSSTPTTTTSSSLSKMSSSLTNWRMRLRSNSSNRTQSDSSRHKDFNSTTFRLGQFLNNTNNAGNNSSGGTGVSGSFNVTDISSAGMILDLRKIFGPQFIEHSLINDIHAIQSMKTVKTDIAFARAFVRLALEKKLLSSHLNRLLMDTKLLRHLYTRYAFLRCEEEREQFLVHLLSLNAVDYFSFTRMINQTEVIYEIFICTGRKHSSGVTSTANAWLKIHGHFGSTQVITVPRGHNLIEIKNRNLGLLSTIQIGHDNSGSAPKWFIEFILVYNRTTNHLYLFPCYHWFGLGIEDDALERVLIGEQIRIASNDPRLLFTSPSSDPIECSQNLPNRCSSPSLSRRNSDRKNLSAVMIHERVASAVNRLLKFFCKTNRTNATVGLTSLWCGEHGLVPALHLVFSYGFRSSRMFQRKIYIWDYFEKVASDFSVELRLTTEQQQSNMDSQMMESQNCTGTISFPFSTHSLPRSLTSKFNRGQQDDNKVDQFSSTFSPVIKSSYGFPHSPSFSFMNETYSIINSQNEQKYASGRYNLFSFSQPTSPALSRFIPNNNVLSQNTSTDIPVNRRLASMSSDIQNSALQFTMYVQNVTNSSITLGKKGKFERFICRALRDHLLSNWLSILAISSITLQMYEPRSFLLNHDLRQIIQELLSSLDEFNLSFESALLGDS